MKKSELTKLYRKVAKEVGFKEDPSHKGWMPKLGPGDYKSKIIHGFTDKGPATLTVGPGGLIGLELLKLAEEYSLFQNKKSPCVVLPKVFEVGNLKDISWVVKERVEGTVPLVNFPFSNSEERGQIAELYWNTVSIFSGIEEQQNRQSEISFEDFFRERFNKWLDLHSSRKNKLDRQKHEVLKGIVDNMFCYIFYESNISDSTELEMRLFFRNSGATDIVQDGLTYYLPSSDIDFFPQFYGAAYFVWNILMHSLNESVTDEIELWREEFYFSCSRDLKDKFHTAFYLLLFERVIATLLVDIPLRRSPFDEDAKRTENGEKIFVEVLKYLLNIIPTLVKNEPFKENFEGLKKIYKL